ncbi:hypothetical protein TNCV_150041, partial [Trichonephila clavipes]
MPSPFSINPTHLTAPRRLIRRLPFITRTCSRAKATANAMMNFVGHDLAFADQE